MIYDWGFNLSISNADRLFVKLLLSPICVILYNLIVIHAYLKLLDFQLGRITGHRNPLWLLPWLNFC